MDTQYKPIRVAALGVEPRTFNTLQLFFHGQCQDDFILVDEDAADICIIDMDSHQAGQMLEGQKLKYPDRPAILLSLNSNDNYDGPYVRKPMRLAALSSALSEALEILERKSIPMTHSTLPPGFLESQVPTLNKVAKFVNKAHADRIQKKVVFRKYSPKSKSSATLESFSEANDSGIMFVTKPDIKLNPYNPIQMSKLHYQPAQLLQGYFQQAYNLAIEKKCDVLLEGPWRPITIFYKSREMSVKQNFRHLYALAAMRFKPKDIKISVLDNKSGQGESATNRANYLPKSGELVIPIEQFLWKLTLRTSRGRVPIGTDFDKPIQLVRWPNLTRNAVTPHAFRIAALWSKRPTSLKETSEILAIPLQFVFIFYSAAVALNLVTHSSRPANRNVKMDDLPRHEHSSVFQTLIHRLRNI